MLAKIVLLLSLLILLWQDWNYRRIHIVLPLFVFACSYYLSATILSYKNILFNIAFFGIVFVFLVLYMSYKAKTFLNPLQHYFGLGDVLFYLAIAPLFYLQNYAVFFILSMLFAIIAHTLTKKYSTQSTVPLAGFSALLLCLVILLDYLNWSTYKFTLL